MSAPGLLGPVLPTHRRVGLGTTVEKSEKSNIICLDGAIGIDSAAELKSTLSAALNSGSAVVISLERCAYLDVTAIQLLWAAGREAKASGIAIEFSGRLPEQLSATLSGAGFECFPATR
jgi:ABC-type transporter Mla MlaB component